jgi:hypothetical protein
MEAWVAARHHSRIEIPAHDFEWDHPRIIAEFWFDCAALPQG